MLGIGHCSKLGFDVRSTGSVPHHDPAGNVLPSLLTVAQVAARFAPGQELSAHTTLYPATLTFLKGDAQWKLGTEEQRATEGTFVYMRPNLEHGVKAENEVAMLLTMIKNTPAPPAST